MANNIELSINSNTSTFLCTTIGQGVSLGFDVATGTFAVMKARNDGTLFPVTDDAGAALSVTADLTINAWVGAGTDIHIVSTGTSGTSVITANPLKSTN